MGILSRIFIPRRVRRAVHPKRVIKSALTPTSIKRARRALHPINYATYGAARALRTKRPSRKPFYKHGSCTVRHRAPEAAARCQRGE